MSFISLHTSHYSVQESWRMLNVKRGWKNNKNNKVFWFYVWVGKRVYKSKVKIYKNGKQIFSNIFSGLKTSSQSIRNYQPVSSTQVSSIWSIWIIFYLGKNTFMFETKMFDTN